MRGPHQNQQLYSTGAPVDEASRAVVMVHGRGATAQGILGMASEFDQTGVAYLAPQAAGNEWYPASFLAPVEKNEPGRTSGLEAIETAVTRAADAGISTERIFVLGFSQGGCLASEFVARQPVPCGGLAALSGGLIGQEIDSAAYEGDLAGSPAFFGCSTTDPHIPEQRVHDSAAVFEQLNADVTVRLYDGLGHGINQDELDTVASLVASL